MGYRPKRGISALLEGFNDGYETAGRVLRDMDLAKIAGAKEEAATVQSPTFTGMTGSYDEQDAPMQSQEVTKFLGKTYDQPLTDQQKDAARMQAMAGVYGKYGDPAEGIRLRSQAAQLERGIKQDAREDSRFKREEEAAKREEQWRTGREQLFQGSNFGQIQRANAESKSKYDAELAEYNRRAQSGETGLAAPTQPELKAYGYAQSLLDNLGLAAHDVQFGKAGPETLTKLAQMHKEFQDEGYAKALRLAQSGAAPQEIARAFNESGKLKVDPAMIQDGGMVTTPDGVKTRVLSIKQPDGSTMRINTLSELEALGQADKIYTRLFQVNQDKRAGAQLSLSQNADRRQQAEFDAAAPKRELGSTLAALQLELGKTDDPEKQRAIQQKIATIQSDTSAKASYKVEMGDVTSALGDPAVGPDGKPVTDIMTGRQVVNRNTEKEQAFFQWMRENGITDTNKGLALYLGQKGDGGAAGSPPKINSPTELAKLPKGTRYTAPDGSVRIKQ